MEFININNYNLILANCFSSCGNNMECTAPNNCTCMTGWTGSDCLTGILNYVHIVLLLLLSY